MRDVYLQCNDCKLNYSLETLDAINNTKLCEDAIACVCGGISFSVLLLEDTVDII